ncbi:MAG: hypothetical protein GKS01_11750 [Alphaproteobacteria bacterium]|nr:hypothetical protein [Alphaproteobacteria bacterium]
MTADIWVFLIFTAIFMGGAGYLTGQALASTWRPIWQLIAYSLLLGGFDRFFVYALFKGQLLSASGYVMDSCVIMLIAFLGYRITRVSIMVRQYPWLYCRKGLLGWKNIDSV